MNESDPSPSSPSTKLILLRPQSASVVPSSQANNDVGSDETEAKNVAVQPNAESAEIGFDASLPIIYLDREFHVVLDDAMRALASDPLLFAKGDQLVRVVVEGDSPRLIGLASPQLRELLSARARWVGKDKAVHPPAAVATTLAKRGNWNHLLELRAMTAFPVLSANGELCVEEGYDAVTRTFYRAGCEVSVPENPTLMDAKGACDRLLDLVSEFPFAGPAHSSAWLSALLTPLSRFMHDGNAPLVVIQANMPGSGKSLLAQLIATIVAGSTVPVMACEKDEPNRKEILSKLRTAPSIALIDNVIGRFGGPVMATMITARSFEDRSLGHLKTLSAPNDTTWMMTGNRTILARDMARRCLHIRLQCNSEKPHLRAGFRYPNVLEHARNRRGELLSAALTILKAYAVAGMPEAKLEPWGSFEEWSRIVRGSLVWCEQPDPAQTRQELEDDAEEGVSEHARLVLAWEQLQGAMRRSGGITVKDALVFLDGKPTAAPLLREFIEALPRRGGKPDTHSIARRLREAKDRNFSGKMLRSLGSPKEALRWRVEQIKTSAT